MLRIVLLWILNLLGPIAAAYIAAAYGQDGWGGSGASFGNLIKATAEINESIFPTRIVSCDYQTDGGGPGQWRGAPGSSGIKAVTAPCTLTTYMVGLKYTMPGIAGAMDGAPNQLVLYRQAA